MCLGFVVGFFCCCEAFWFVGFLCVGFFLGCFYFFFHWRERAGVMPSPLLREDFSACPNWHQKSEFFSCLYWGSCCSFFSY